MFVDDEMEIYAAPRGCCECGDVDGVCASAGSDLYCGPCWTVYQAEKDARKAKKAAEAK